jgi:hypothetical protein
VITSWKPLLQRKLSISIQVGVIAGSFTVNGRATSSVPLPEISVGGKAMIAKALLVLTAGCAAVYGSDPVAVYARVDRAEVQSDTIRVWGVFAVAKANDNNFYEPPAKGYLFFKLPERNQDAVRAEWNDFKSVAGTKELVAFGARWTWKAKVRRADEKPENPDVFQPDAGVTKVRGRTDYAPIRALLDYKE